MRAILSFVCHAVVLSIISQTSSLIPTVQALTESGTKKHHKLLILGLGRVGLECGRLAAPQFDHVVGTVRSWPSPSATNLKDEDGDDVVLRIPFPDHSDSAEWEKHLQDASHILWTIPLKRDEPKLENALESMKDQGNNIHNSKWIGFVSTSGVYGNHNGEWVTEESPLLCTPESNADLYRQVEEDLQASCGNSGCQIFRCAGIYDTTRSALHTVYKTGGPSPPALSPSSTPESSTNRIHSYDIARAIVASMTSNARTSQTIRESRIYNLADDEPAPRSTVLNYAADLLKSVGVSLPTPKEENPPSTQVSASKQPPITTKRERRRLTDRKLVSNKRMKEELLLSCSKSNNNETATLLVYPTYREGLQSILGDPSTPWSQYLD